jgi:hypothetical protein
MLRGEYGSRMIDSPRSTCAVCPCLLLRLLGDFGATNGAVILANPEQAVRIRSRMDVARQRDGGPKGTLHGPVAVGMLKDSRPLRDGTDFHDMSEPWTQLKVVRMLYDEVSWGLEGIAMAKIIGVLFGPGPDISALVNTRIDG